MGYAASSPWWYYLAALPLFWLPWSLLPPLHLGGGLFRGLKNARREENQGLAFVWIALLGGLALLSTLNYKEPAHLLPLLGPLAVLSGRGVLGLSPLRSLILQRLIALIFLASAAALALLPLYYSGNMPAALLSWLRHLPLPVLEIKPAGLFALPVIMLAGFVLCLGTVKARRPENLLLLVPLICTLFSYPLLRFTLPSLSENLSPQKVSQIIKQETENGFEPLAVNAPAWAFSYYAGHNIAQAQNRDEAMERAQSGAKLLLITPLEESAAWLKDGLFRETLRFWLFSSEYALMARLDSPEEETPPEVMEENAPPEESVEPEEIEENLEQEETEKYSVPEGTEKMEKMSNI
jgi:hypothetical protein